MPAKRNKKGESSSATARKKARRRPSTTKRKQTARAKGRPRERRIDARLKTITIAAEPPIDANTDHLDGGFRSKLDTALSAVANAGKRFKLVEGFRTVQRQQWLYGSGRTNVPYARPGPILTNADGVNQKSKHQGNGSEGTGRAADCYPLKEDGQV